MGWQFASSEPPKMSCFFSISSQQQHHTNTGADDDVATITVAEEKREGVVDVCRTDHYAFTHEHFQLGSGLYGDDQVTLAEQSYNYDEFLL